MATQMTERYCPICGKPGQPEFNRFGEWACSETHAEEHVVEVREHETPPLDVADSGRHGGWRGSDRGNRGPVRIATSSSPATHCWAWVTAASLSTVAFAITISSSS